jgi:hypothetical protein
VIVAYYNDIVRKRLLPRWPRADQLESHRCESSSTCVNEALRLYTVLPDGLLVLFHSFERNINMGVAKPPGSRISPELHSQDSVQSMTTCLQTFFFPLPLALAKRLGGGNGQIHRLQRPRGGFASFHSRSGATPGPCGQDPLRASPAPQCWALLRTAAFAAGINSPSRPAKNDISVAFSLEARGQAKRPRKGPRRAPR